MKILMLGHALSLVLFLNTGLAQIKPGPFLENARTQPVVKVDPEKRYARTGGLVTQSAEGPRILLLNCSDAKYESSLKQIQRDIQAIASLPCDVDHYDKDIDDIVLFAQKCLARTNVAAVIVMDTSDKYPPMLVAPESAWGYFNLNYLKSDKCDDRVLHDRIVKQGWRTLAATLGAIYTTSPVCLMKPVTAVGQLDTFNLFVISPEPLNKLQNQAKLLGIKPVKRTTYSIAVKEGWAPTPTNDVQKAIWQRHGKTPPKTQ